MNKKLLLVFIIIFAVYSTLLFLLYFLSSRDGDSFRLAVASFSGAFFSFLFLRIGDYLNRYVKKLELNQAVLFKLEFYFNDYLVITQNNIFVINDYIKVFADSVGNSSNIPIYSNSLKTFNINRDFFDSLLNTDFINELFRLNLNLQTINEDIESLERSNNQIVNAFLSKNIDRKEYLRNMEHNISKYVDLKKFLEHYFDEIINVYASGRVVLKQSLGLFNLLFYKKSTYGNDHLLNKNIEIMVIKNELSDSGNFDELRIKIILTDDIN